MKLYQKDRTEPLQNFDDLHELQSLQEITQTVKLTFSRHEIGVVQLLLLSELEQETVAVACGGDEKRVRCINTEGVDKWGRAFKKSIEVSRREIQPLYFTTDFSGLTQAEYRCEIEFSGTQSRSITLEFQLTDEPVENSGYNDLWRLARLQWLNSAAFLDQNAPPPYTPVTVEGAAVSILGRQMRLGPDALPAQALSFFDESIALKDTPQAQLLALPLCFNIQGEDIDYGPLTSMAIGDNAALRVSGSGERVDLAVEAKLCYEGFFEYWISVKAKQDCTLPDVALTAALTPEASVYNNGFGKPGGYFQDIHFRWNNDHQDSVFIGGINCGLRVKLKAEQYRRPLVNIYYRTLDRVVPAEAWDNHGRGTIDITRAEDQTARFAARTGPFEMRAGEERVFRFELHFTPFRPVDYQRHYAVRYRHNGALRSWREEIEEAREHGLTHINIHHANDLNPFINYPFIEVDEMKAFARAAHDENLGIKFYYTTREHSNHMAEIFPYKSLGDEIILRKKGKGQTWAEGKSEWLHTYFGDNITPAWRVEFERGKYKGEVDESFIVRPDSRLDNYYVEGLNWLVRQIGIDGIYVDDTAMDRTTLERARKVLNQNGGVIDMHMWNHAEDRAGNISCMNLYTELFPFLDSIWVGEGYTYDELDEDYMLCEVSGLPYGLASEMLQDGGSPWYGMIYAMNTRYGWQSSERVLGLYSLWDSFGIQDAEMRGYWHSRAPVKADQPGVLVTTYVKADKALVAVYNKTAETLETLLHIDEEKLGFAPVRMMQAEVKGLQKEKPLALREPLRIASKQGVLLVLE